MIREWHTWALTTFRTYFCSGMSSHTYGGRLKIRSDDLKKAIQRSIRLIPEYSLVSELEMFKTHLDDVIRLGGDYVFKIN